MGRCFLFLLVFSFLLGEAMLDREQYCEVVKLVKKMIPMSAFSYGIIEAFDAEKRLVKLMLEPSGVETGWCRVLQGAFIDKVGAEALVAAVRGDGAEEYVVMGIIE